MFHHLVRAGAVPVGGGFDADAQAFFTATGISDETIQAAVDALVIGLKADSVWTKFLAIYPLVGGTSGAHLVNLKTPGTKNMTWNGTITHDANGATGNGSNGYGNTGINQSTDLAEDNEHLSVYSRTNVDNGTYIDTGILDASSNGTRMTLRATDSFASRCQNTSTGFTSNSSSLGYFSLNRTASGEYRKRVNGTNYLISAASDTAVINASIFVMAMNNNGSPASYSPRNYAWFAFGQGLTETEDGNVQTRVETFQDALSRGVV